MRSLLALLLVVAAALFAPRAALAQAAPATTARPASTTVRADGAEKVEEEAADSPRASMRTFYDLCERSRFEDAARYLDLPPGAQKRGAEVTRKLYVVLTERLAVRPETLSPLADGKVTDGLPPGTEELGKIVDAKERAIPIRLVKHTARTPDDEPRWVFSQTTVAAVEPLYASLKGRWIRERMPGPLMVPGPLSLYYWQWIALPVLAALCLTIGKVLTWVSGLVIGWLTQKWSFFIRILPRLKRPVTLAWGLVLFALAMPQLGLTVRADELVDRVLKALGWISFFWALSRAVTVAGDEIGEAEWAKPKPGVRSLTSVGVKLGKVVVGALALMVGLSELGYPVTSVIAGLGIGGVALALAAQKTVENLFGSISILADQPFVVGDTIKVDTVEGTVESIGLRSTRMRTADRTLIVIPNGKLADMRIESLGARERIRFATKLLVAREATVDQLKAIVDGVKKRLAAHEKVTKDDLSVRLVALGDHSFDIEVSAMVQTLDLTEFAGIREALLHACIEEVQKGGGRLAVPTRRILTSREAEAS